MYVSILANYSCEGAVLCPGSTDLSQFDFECLRGVWTASILGSTAFVKRNDPVANFTTQFRSDCLICINPSVVAGSDPVTHCRGKWRLLPASYVKELAALSLLCVLSLQNALDARAQTDVSCLGRTLWNAAIITTRWMADVCKVAMARLQETSPVWRQV